MKLILARHGNTFQPGDKTVWVGARTDMPLVEKGLAQASAIAAAILRNSIEIGAIYAGPLRRTLETANAIAGTLQSNLAVNTAHELVELDYGVWEGKSNDEIRLAFGSADIDNWQKFSIWPDGYGWTPDEYTVQKRWNDLMDRIDKETSNQKSVLIVSSNGVFRVVAKAIGIDAQQAKMDTGSLSSIELRAGRYHVNLWNQRPENI